MAPLPRVIRGLVQRRRAVKDLIKGEKDPVSPCLACCAGLPLPGCCAAPQPLRVHGVLPLLL
jgi:hypothetical protein